MYARFLQFFNRKRGISSFIIVAASISIVFFPLAASASIGELFMATVFTVIIEPVGALLAGMTSLLVYVAKYNDFGTSSLVEAGWPVVRDVANMFFVFILLIIAIGTIVRWQKINYKQNLRRLILMALLINFSKTIVLFFIDLSQIISLTFINAFYEALQGGVMQLLGLDQVINSAGGATSFVTFLVAAIMVLVACIVVAVILFVFLARILILWILIIFSPLAFIASVLPQTEKYYNQWWDMLGKNVTVAPVLSFMLWLIFSTVGTAVSNIASPGGDVGGVLLPVILQYCIGIGMLIASIRIALTMGAFGGALAAKLGDKGVGYLGAKGKAALNYVGDRGKSAALRAGVAMGNRVGAMTAGESKNLGRRFADATIGKYARKGARASTVGLSRLDEKREKPHKDYISRLDVNQRRDLAKEKTGFLPSQGRPVQRLLAKDYGQSGESIAKEVDEMQPDKKQAANQALNKEIDDLAKKEAALKPGDKLSKEDAKRSKSLQVALSKTNAGMAMDNKHVDLKTIFQNASENDYDDLLHDKDPVKRATRRARLDKEAHKITAAMGQKVLTSNASNESKDALLQAQAGIYRQPGASTSDKAAADRTFRSYADANSAVQKEVNSRLDSFTGPHQADAKYHRAQINKHKQTQMVNQLSRFTAGDTVNLPGGLRGNYIGPSTKPGNVRVQGPKGAEDINIDVYMQMNQKEQT